MLWLHFHIRNSKHVCFYLTDQVVDHLENGWCLTLVGGWHKMSIADMQYGTILVCSQLIAQNKIMNNKTCVTVLCVWAFTFSEPSFSAQSTSVASSQYRKEPALSHSSMDACNILYYLPLLSFHKHSTPLHTLSNKIPISVACSRSLSVICISKSCSRQSPPVQCLT